MKGANEIFKEIRIIAYTYLITCLWEETRGQEVGKTKSIYNILVDTHTGFSLKPLETEDAIPIT